MPLLRDRSAVALVSGLCGAAVLAGCQSHARGRSSTEQAMGGDATALAASSLVVGGPALPLGESPLLRTGPRYVVSLQVFVSGMTCPFLSRESLALRVTDLTDHSVVSEGLPLKQDWKAVGEVRMFRGPHELSVVEVTRNRVIASRNATFDGSGTWRLALEVPCQGRSVSFLPVASL
jgi:hypothetical protein